MANRLDIGTGLVNPRVNPEFGVRPAFAGKLVAVDIERQEIIHSHQCGTHTRREDERIRARNARADMAKGGGDPLLMENMAGGDDVLFEFVDVHGRAPSQIVSDHLCQGAQNVYGPEIESNREQPDEGEKKPARWFEPVRPRGDEMKLGRTTWQPR